MNKSLVIAGPTASGKTAVAVQVARHLDGEIISIDSRQVYRGLDIGTGKDLIEYDRAHIPYHLIDIVEPGVEYHVAQFQEDAAEAYQDIIFRGKVPVLCGGSGMYLEAVLENHRYTKLPVDPALREKLNKFTLNQLADQFARGPALDFDVDVTSKKRLIRAIEMQQSGLPLPEGSSIPEIPIYIIASAREERRTRISSRLQRRIDEGLVEEVRQLREKCSDESLIRLGLEYKFITHYLKGDFSYEEMFARLETAIHQFAKRQMTWFRRMERRGYNVIPVDSSLTDAAKATMISESFSRMGHSGADEGKK